MIFAFVILHYMVDKDTIECVNSIFNNINVKDNDEIYTIIVDNGSPNDSYEKLTKEFNNRKQIVLLHNSENIGYARGNNIGFRFAKKELNADYIVLLNNDTIIEQADWIYVASKLFEVYRYAVLGPDIITADGKHQNPLDSQKWTICLLYKKRLKQRIKYILTYLGIDKIFIRSEKEHINQKVVNSDMLDVVLHGACFIFSKLYIEEFDGLCDKTFLYMEEEILKLYLEHKKLLSLYSPRLCIYHKEDMATKAINKTARKRKLEKYRCWIDSSFVYEQIIKKNKYKEEQI